MPPNLDDVYEHLVALRRSLSDIRWMSWLDPAILAIFNELLRAAQALVPESTVVRAIRRQDEGVRPTTLLLLVDQVLVALAG